jgi:SAM-dependent methyltransferase
VTYEFCTLFDAGYLPRGLVLYGSLVETGADFRLRVFCMDDETHDLLSRMNLPRLTPVSLADLERFDRDLLGVKSTRTPVEYFWTATPVVCLYCLEREPELGEITYLDADVMFFADPQPVFEELGPESVLIVPHRYAAGYAADAATSGVYNVQFMTFRRTPDGLEALRWWRERCIEWCYARVEDGKFGDQKYLDDWPQRFRGVHVLQHPGGGLAPWNASRYRLERRDGSVLIDGQPLIFYHYHSLALYSGLDRLARLRVLPPPYRSSDGDTPLVWRSGYPMSGAERRLVWGPYLRRLGRAVADVRLLDPSFDRGFVARRPFDVVPEAASFAAGYARPAVRRVRRLLDTRRGVRPDDSWRSRNVARQMAKLADQQLEKPDAIAPFSAFMQAVEALFADHPLPQPARFLDFGCGVGQYSELLERRFPGRFDYTGCDYAEEMIEEARARWPGRRFVVNDVFDNQLDLDSFDVVCASSLVDVVADYETALHVLLGAGAPYVLLHRQRIGEGPSSVDLAPGYRGQTTYRVRLDRADLERLAAANGRRIERSFDVEGEVRSFLLVREETD